jgi:hypothetical protein
MQVEVEILVQTITAQYGVLSQGDILRTSPEFAKHLVDDCGAAKYTKAAAAPAKPPESQPVESAKPVTTPSAVPAPSVTTVKPAAAPKAEKSKNV